MTMADRDKLLDRVRKLLALTESPNVHEAALAAARAQALIDAHRLQGLLDAEEDAPVVDGRSAPLESGRRLRKWKVVLASALAGQLGRFIAAEDGLNDKGQPSDASLRTACETALDYVHQAIKSAPNIGQGNGPLAH